jgi:hypothetical protein
MDTMITLIIGAMLPLFMITILMGFAGVAMIYLSHRQVMAKIAAESAKLKRDAAAVAARKSTVAQKRTVLRTRKKPARKKSRAPALRSAEDLSHCAAGLSALAGIMDSLGGDWHLSGGTALGVAREGDFLPWGKSVRIAVKAEQFATLWPDLISAAQDAGFEIQTLRISAQEHAAKIVLQRDRQKFEIVFWTLDGDHRVHDIYRRPAQFFDTTEQRVLRGRSYPFPAPLEDYLDAVYSNWRIPAPNADADSYLNPAHVLHPEVTPEASAPAASLDMQTTPEPPAAQETPR